MADKNKKKKMKYEDMLEFEHKAWDQGFKIVAGIDEAGRGPLAGPVVAAACILNPDVQILGLNDSKKLTPAARNRLYCQILEHSLSWQVGIVDHETIDDINILQATCQAMREATENLSVHPQLLLVDAVKLKQVEPEVWPIIRGDGLSVSIAAASILAKVTRDRIMEEYDVKYPQYSFARHKGYGTPQHYEALFKYGPCPIHRLTFIRKVLETKKPTEQQISLFEQKEYD